MDKVQSKQYHHFIEISANKIKQSQKIPEFQYMEQKIKINYKQLKKSKTQKAVKPSEKFTQYFKSLDKQDQIKFYQKQLNLLKIAINSKVLESQYLNDQGKKQGQIYIKKSLLNKWQKKNIKIQNFKLYIQKSKKLKSYPLKCYHLRKSKNKQFFGWVLEIINDAQNKKLKNFHCGVKSMKQFDQWYNFLQSIIDKARIQYFQQMYLGINFQNKIQKRNGEIYGQITKQKTLTERVIDEQLKVIHQAQQIEQTLQQKKQKQKQINQQNYLKKEENQQTIKLNPNVFQRLFNNIDLSTFTQNINTTLIQNGPGYRLFQKVPYPGQQFRMRINIMISFKKQQVFKALNQQITFWNNEIEVFSIKTNISSENSALIYQKDKSQGMLYRDRDYLFFRHCFSKKALNPTQKDKIFIVDKSIDSINYPPFMSVARGQKRLIWCICGNSQENQCMLIVQGQIKGGGYNNLNNDKQMTNKFFKKILTIETYLKEKKFMGSESQSVQPLFQQNWQVEEQQIFYDIQDDMESLQSQQSQQAKKQQEKKQKRKLSSTSDQQYNQFDQFIKKTSEENLGSQQLTKSQINIQDDFFKYTPPEIKYQDKTVIIPQNYLKYHHIMNPLEKSSNPSWYPHYRGHHLWKGQWAICPTGGLNYVDEQKMNEQKKVLTFIIRRIGKNILSGKGVLNISLPVDIFCRQSNIERIAASFGFAPVFLQKASKLNESSEMLKYIIATASFSSLIYLTMQKPFNPILGETYQSWIDGCPVYFQQISHHPPIAAYLMIGRGYKLSGTLQAKMELSLNSGTGINEGIFTVQFDNGKKFYYTTPPGQLSGLTYGERKLLLVGKSYYWNIEDGLFVQIQFNPSAKHRRFFGGISNQGTGDSQLHDFYEGTLKKYRKQDLQEFFKPKKGDFRKIMAIPKQCPKVQPLNDIYKITGRWTKYLSFNGQKMFDVDQCRYYTMKDQQNPLPSHSNFREDVVYRRLNNCVVSQQFKQILQVKQRKDKKLRQLQNKNRK